ncbi:hypothetical protein N9X89_03405 [Luminiphilus sp.]|nr:hypothetical protein [Luminiphilus sp.]
MPRPIKLNAASAVSLRGGTWWFIKAVPKALRDSIGKSRWRFSLNTTDRAVALQRAQEFIDEIKAQLLATNDPSSTYFKELAKLRGVSREDAEHLMDSLHPELNEGEAPQFYAARQVAQDVPPPAELFMWQSVATDSIIRMPTHSDGLSV